MDLLEFMMELGKIHDFIYNRSKTKKMVLNMLFFIKKIKIKVDSYDSLPLEKTSIFHNVIILINSVSKNIQNYYYYNKLS